MYHSHKLRDTKYYQNYVLQEKIFGHMRFLQNVNVTSQTLTVNLNQFK